MVGLLRVDVPFTGAFTSTTNGGERAGTSASGIWDVGGFPDRARTADAAYLSTTLGPMAGATRKTQYLQGVGFTTPAALRSNPIHRIGVKVTANAGSGAGDTTDVRTDAVRLVKAGSILTAVDAGDATTARQWGGVETKTYWFTPGNLGTLGVKTQDLLSNPADFGAAIGFLEDDSAGSYGLFALVDYLGLVFEYLIDEDNYMDRDLLKQGGLEVLGQEALASVSSSASPFTTIPATCKGVEITVNAGGGDLNIRWDGGTATTSTGNYYPAGATVLRAYGADQLALAKGIQLNGTAAGWITYFGPK